ncbi:hypothetical protein BWZ22_15490 [Seonamhaeicola sp. S2-3]|uniref:hypothetical protein n=1 Tax=Seonamhaeicola sp. S2-3 TaxID=1936081 RepID=UPI000972D7F7|nr:hypothetical protein [Seonamhaeicola sp. S2-3]APY12534.1 hypothetical protein BWZ22_15490 [Seonamhaeicola sp. S2-3]
MKKTIIGLFLLVLSFQMNSQTIALPDTFISLNYEYLEALEIDNEPLRVKKLEKTVLNYNNKEIADLCDTDKDVVNVSFYVDNCNIIASYDKNGKIIKTIEKYNNVRLPLSVMQAIAKQYPDCGIVEDVYLVKYQSNNNTVRKEYKVKIKSKDEILTVKTNEKGDFI